MSSGAAARPAHETWHPVRRGYVIVNMGGSVRHIPLWWHPRNITRLPSIFRGYREMMRHLESANDLGSRQFLRTMARGPVRTVPRDYDSLRAMGFYD